MNGRDNNAEVSLRFEDRKLSKKLQTPNMKLNVCLVHRERCHLALSQS